MRFISNWKELYLPDDSFSCQFSLHALISSKSNTDEVFDSMLTRKMKVRNELFWQPLLPKVLSVISYKD